MNCPKCKQEMKREINDIYRCSDCGCFRIEPVEEEYIEKLFKKTFEKAGMKF